MKKDLVFYANKIEDFSGNIFVRILPNQNGKDIWIPWNDGACTPLFPKSEEDFLGPIDQLLKSFSEYEDFKILFNEKIFTLGGNPYFNKGKNKRWLDQHLQLFPRDIAFVNGLFKDVIDEVE